MEENKDIKKEEKIKDTEGSSPLSDTTTDKTDASKEAVKEETASSPEAVVAKTEPTKEASIARPARKKNFIKRNRRVQTRVKPEFDQKMIDLRRVVRVVAGGRRFSFSAVLVAGNRNGKVGVGVGKASDTSLAIEKAFRDAKKKMITVKRDKNMSIPHEVETKEKSARIMIYPAPGRGVVAGSSVRTVLELAGVKDVGAKVLSRSKNKLNIARAAIKALKKL